MRAAREAALWIGTPYVHGASRRGVGCDCLGLVRGVWRAVAGREPERVPPYGPHWGEASGRETLLEACARHLVPAGGAVRKGQVLLFRMKERAPAKHLGIAVAGGRFVHAYAGHGVVASPLSQPWARRIAARFDFPWEV